MIRDIVNGNAAYLAPAVFNPLCARLAEQAGFKVLYLGGGALGDGDGNGDGDAWQAIHSPRPAACASAWAALSVA